MIEPIVIEGSGDDVVSVSEAIGAFGGIALLDANYSGESNFIVTALDDSLQSQDGVINEIGAYSGRHPLGFRSDQIIAFLEVEASGPWQFTIRDVIESRRWTDQVDGVGSDVIIYDGEAALLDYEYVGDSNFIVTFYGFDGSIDGLINEIDSVNGRVPVSGAGVFEVQATGAWSFVASPI